MSPCCKCNSSNSVCRNCVCVKANRTCDNCQPGRKKACQNSKLPRFSTPNPRSALTCTSSDERTSSPSILSLDSSSSSCPARFVGDSQSSSPVDCFDRRQVRRDGLLQLSQQSGTTKENSPEGDVHSSLAATGNLDTSSSKSFVSSEIQTTSSVSCSQRNANGRWQLNSNSVTMETSDPIQMAGAAAANVEAADPVQRPVRPSECLSGATGGVILAVRIFYFCLMTSIQKLSTGEGTFSKFHLVLLEKSLLKNIHGFHSHLLRAVLWNPSLSWLWW